MMIFHPPLSRDNATTIEKAILKIRFDTNENLYVFRNNKQVQRFRGSKNQVTPNPSYFISQKDDTWIHNHPGGSSFSIEDIQMAAFHNIKTFILSTPNFIYFLERIGDTWGFDAENAEVKLYLNTCFDRTNELLDKLIQKNEIAFYEKDEIFFHYLWLCFFQKYESKYIQKEF